MTRTVCIAGLAAFSVIWAGSPHAATLRCAADSVKVGNVCVDKYEASVWSIAPSNTGLIRKVQKGMATLDDLMGSGAVQLGRTGAPFSLTAYPANFPADGNWTPVLGSDPPSPGVYAVSIRSRRRAPSRSARSRQRVGSRTFNAGACRDWPRTIDGARRARTLHTTGDASAVACSACKRLRSRVRSTMRAAMRRAIPRTSRTCTAGGCHTTNGMRMA